MSFFSHYVSSAQRLPNGNTLVTEGWDGRIFRARRVPYVWVPQLPRPIETRVARPDNTTFRVPGSGER